MVSASHAPFLKRLPLWISRWVGYRQSPPLKLPQYEVCFWSFIASFCGLSLIQAVFAFAPYFIRKGVPPVVASFGAGAVLIYGAIETPLAQPHALIAGQFLGALTGVCITKLFQLLPTEEMFEQWLWICGSLACACAIVVMQVTRTTHPPGGAAALLAAISPEVRQIGWYYLPVVLLSSMLALAVGLIINNIRRQYPAYWLCPGQVKDVNDEDVSTDGHQTQGLPSFFGTKGHKGAEVPVSFLDIRAEPLSGKRRESIHMVIGYAV